MGVYWVLAGRTCHQTEMMMRNATCSIGLACLGFCLYAGCSQQPPSPQPLSRQTPIVSGTVVSGTTPESLISRLVANRATGNQQSSPQEPPLPLNPQAAQTIQQLQALGTAAFPALIAHRNDQRYSYSIVGEGLYNYGPGEVVRIDKTVGDICVEVIARQLYVGQEYQGCVQFIPNVVPEKDLAEWWSARSSKSLSELRKEAMEQTISVEKRRIPLGGITGDCAKNRVEELEADLRGMKSNGGQPATSPHPPSDPPPAGPTSGPPVE